MDALLRVQAHRGLVKDQEGRVPQQRLGNAHPLPLAAGEGTYLGLGLLLQIHRPDHIPDGRLRAAQTLEGGHVVQKLGDSQLVEKAKVLRQITKAGLQLPLNLVQRRPVYQNAPLSGHQSCYQQFHQGGLACPVGAQQADEAGGFQVQVQPLQGLLSAGIGHTDVLDLEFHMI